MLKKLVATILPIDLETKMASVSSIVQPFVRRVR